MLPLPISAIVNGRYPAHGDTSHFHVGSLLIADEHIAGGQSSALPAPQLDATDCVVLPGFIDLHIHGSAGYDVMDAVPDCLPAISSFLARHGVTGFTPTTMTAPHLPTLAAVGNVAAALAQPMPGAAILGIHLEGPYISPQFPGAQEKSNIRPADLAEFAALLAAGPVKLITLAPEEAGAERLIDAAQHAGVGVIIGHSAATYQQAVAAFDRGVRQATHTFNAMTGLHHRKPGVVGAVLSDDRVFAQLIADTIHVHPAAMKILARCKGPDRLLLITDAIRATGLAEGEYDLGGQPVSVRNGQCTLSDGTLAGSLLTMDSALSHFLAATGWPLEKAWPVASRTPAAALGIGDAYGSIAPGYRADLVILDNALDVVATVVGGQLVYLRDQERMKRPLL